MGLSSLCSETRRDDAIHICVCTRTVSMDLVLNLYTNGVHTEDIGCFIFVMITFVYHVTVGRIQCTRLRTERGRVVGMRLHVESTISHLPRLNDVVWMVCPGCGDMVLLRSFPPSSEYRSVWACMGVMESTPPRTQPHAISRMYFECRRSIFYRALRAYIHTWIS